MVIDVRTPEGRAREMRNVALAQAKKKLLDAASELDYLIVAIPTGTRRNTVCDANIHTIAAVHELQKLASEEAP